ncbi:MAG: arginine--tRNA ligase [Chloroflexi bacterium]|nr:arginine--tRNA ligase [Chloroflexota bacterium]
MTIQERIAQLVTEATQIAQQMGDLPADPRALPEPDIHRPSNPDLGDFATALPLKLANQMKMPPMEIAKILAAYVRNTDLLDRLVGAEFLKNIEPAHPGFVNFWLKDSWLAAQVESIRKDGPTYFDSTLGEGQRVQVEFVSINPTGPLHVAHARGGVIGSSLANILKAVGYEVEQEYYFNDAGNQIENFQRSLHARYLQLFDRDAQVPEDGYHGEYMVELAREVRGEIGDSILYLSVEDAISELGRAGQAKILEAIKKDVKLLRINFDKWFSEASLFQDGQYDSAMQLLEDKGFVAERDGAVWFASTKLGEDQDKVLVRGSGVPTYFATDVAYHYDKFVKRNFDRVINVLGADHQGHVALMKPVVQAMGIAPAKLTLIVHQMVTLKRGGDVVKISKRSGDIVTLRELVEEVGVDACRFFFLSRSPDSQMEFDIDLAKKQSAENPVYYVQYAHARIAGILRLATERGIDYEDGDLSLLGHEAELALIRKMLLLPELMVQMATALEPHHLPHYAVELATAYHWFYEKCRVVSSLPEDDELSKARLKLVDAARIALARCLDLMSMDAPDEM